MSFAAAFVQLSFPLLSLAEVLHIAFVLFVVASLLILFRPLLNGILRALLLVLRTRLARKSTAGAGIVPGQRA